MKNLRIAIKENNIVKPHKEEKSQKKVMENYTLQLNKEEVELIKKGLHLEEMSICEMMNDDIIKYKHQLSAVKNLYNKLDAD